MGLGPLAEIAQDSGFTVSGSDNAKSPLTNELIGRGADVSIPQSTENITALHLAKPIDWLVYTSALPSDHPELAFAKSHGIKTTKRDALLVFIIKQQNLKLLAVAGTHGKTTTTAMVVWLFKNLEIPISYSIGTQINFGPSGQFQPDSKYFVYECDEFDRNFLQFYPFISAVTTLGYDHSDTYKTAAEYTQAFRQFVSQSKSFIAAPDINAALHLPESDSFDPALINKLALPGLHNRQNAALAIAMVHTSTGASNNSLVDIINNFPGCQRRFEKLAENMYTDYAHHPSEIAATLQLASELNTNIVVVYQPHQNIRQHEIKNDYGSSFKVAKYIYWLPTYLSREDDSLTILSPLELTRQVDSKKVTITELGESLWNNIMQEKQKGALILFMGAGNIDNWARQQLKK